MSLSVTTIKNLVRKEAGSPALSDADEELVGSKVRFASGRVMVRLRTLQPATDRTKLLEVATTAGQQSYELTALPPGASIVEVHYGPALPNSGARLFPGGSAFVDARPFSDARSPGAVPYRRADRLIDQISRQQCEREYRWDFLAGKVYLDPIPTSDGAFFVVYRETPAEELTEVPDAAERAVVLFGAADLLRFLATRYRGVSVPTRGAASELFDKSTQYEESAVKLEAQAEQECLEILAD